MLTRLQNAASNEEAAKKAAVQRVMQNSANLFDEATLGQMSVDVLEKLAASFSPVNYAPLGGFYTNTGESKPLHVPDMLNAFANAKEA